MSENRIEKWAENFDLNLERAHDRMVAESMVALADREQAELRAEAERWREKAQESGAAYADANTKHHAELDRANRLERLADTLAEKAVDLEDRAQAAEQECRDRESSEADVRARLADAEKALSALRTNVLDLHMPFTLYEPCGNYLSGCDSDHCQESDWSAEFYHADQPTGRACQECRDEDGDPVEWPCDTAALSGSQPRPSLARPDHGYGVTP